MIKIVNLTKSFGSNEVLKGINLQLERGKVYGLVGSNGAGKTTLFRCLAGLDNYRGFITSELSPLKNYTGLLETNPVFMSRITAWEYLKLLCVARGIKEEYFDIQNIFDLPLNQYAETYSTGMKKKLALMGTIVQKNDLFILDEPFNGVDIQSNMIIEKIIHELRRRNKTVIIASHIFSTLRDTCDTIFLIDKGTIQLNAAPEQYDDLEKMMKKKIVEGVMDRIRW